MAIKKFLLAGLLLILLLATANAALQDSLASYYKMNDDAASTTVIDSIGYSNGFAMQDTNVLHTTGRIGGALTFNGIDDRIDTGSKFNDIFNAPFTVSMWVKPKDGHPSPLDDDFFYSNGTFGEDVVYFVNMTDGKLEAVYDSDGDGLHIISTNVAFTDGEQGWHQVAMVVDQITAANAIIYLYLDGSLFYTSAQFACIMADYATEGDNVFIGGSQYFEGDIDNFMVFNKALDVNEVLALYGMPVETRANYFGNTWESQPRTISFDCNNMLCGNLYYAIDDANYQAAWADANIDVAISEDGNHSVWYWSGDTLDNNSQANQLYVAIDSPPTTKDNDFNNTWNTTDQNIQFNCSDALTTCKNLHYSIDDVNYQQAWDGDNNIGVAITTDGNHSIFYWSSDTTDNNETAHIIYAAIDRAALAITITSPPSNHSQKSTTVTLHYEATDTNSGIAKYYVKADTGSWIDNNTNTSYAFTGQSTTTHTYQAKAVNNAGNEATATITATIEPTNNTASGTPGGNNTTTPTRTTTLLEIETTGTPSQQEIQTTLSEAGFTQEQIQKTLQTTQNTQVTQTLTVQKTVSATGTTYKTSITITITNSTGQNRKDAKIVVQIPKAIAENAALINSNSTFTVLKTDPIIQFTIPELQAGQITELTYELEKNISEAEAKTLPQPIIATFTTAQPCDNIQCESTPCSTGTCNNTTGICENKYYKDGTNCGNNKTCQQGACIGSILPETGWQEPITEQAAETDNGWLIVTAAAIITIVSAAGYYFEKMRGKVKSPLLRAARAKGKPEK